jgi:hypothetical protein
MSPPCHRHVLFLQLGNGITGACLNREKNHVSHVSPTKTVIGHPPRAGQKANNDQSAAGLQGEKGLSTCLFVG